MTKLLTVTFFLMSLNSTPAFAQTSDLQLDTLPRSEAEYSDLTDLDAMARRRPKPQIIHRCCAKPSSVYGSMNCSQSTDRLLAWNDAIINCEHKYGNGNCVSGCRRLIPGER